MRAALKVNSKAHVVNDVEPECPLLYVLRDYMALRDHGDQLEILAGLKKGQHVAISPWDVVRENAKVRPVPVKEKAGQ